MPAHDIHAEALDIARRYMRGVERGYEGGGVVDPVVEPAPSQPAVPQQPGFGERAWKTANGLAGVVDYYLGGIPSTMAGLLPWNSLADTKGSAERARSDWTGMYGRGALELAENPVSQATILTPMMARRLEKLRILHPDDEGSSRRMEQVADDYKRLGISRASPSEASDFIERAWQEHGVAPIPNANREYIPYSHLHHPSQTGLKMGDAEVYSGPLKDIYDDPVQYALVPGSGNAKAELKVDPSRLGLSGSYGTDSRRILMTGPSHKAVESGVGHELTHLNATVPGFDLPQGTAPQEFKAHLPPGLTTTAIEATRQRMIDLEKFVASNAPYSDRFKAQLELEQLAQDVQPWNKQFAQYLDSMYAPGEYLARMEQLLTDMKRRGINPRSRRLGDLDDLDVSAATGPSGDLRQHRLYQRPPEKD